MGWANGRRFLLCCSGAATLAIGVGGCALKGGQNISLIAGKTLFIKNCAQCHVLARAHALGVIGPNLDVAFAESLQQGFGRDVIKGVVETQIEYPAIGGRMPKLPLTTRESADIAAYVSYAADRQGQDTGLLGAVGVTHAGTATERNGVVTISADPTGQLVFTAKTATATAGKLTITFMNTSGVPHNLAIQAGNSGASQGSTPILGHTPIAGKETASFTITVTPGVYTYFCEVPGHRQAGMWGTLTVKS